MAFRFRKSIKIAPGIRVNLNKKSASVRIGPRGAGYTISSTGQKRVSASLPGSGLSYSEVVSPKRAPTSSHTPAQLVGSDRNPASKGPVVFLLLAVVFGVGWCSSRSKDSVSPQQPDSRLADNIEGIPEDRAASTAAEPVTTPAATSTSIAHRTAAPVIPSTVTLYTTANVRLRAEPSTSSGIIATIPIGSAVQSSKTEGLWHYATYGNYSGWIRGDYLATSRPVPQRTAPATAMPLVSPPSQQRTAQRPRSPSRSNYLRGPRGGCYYINRNGNKTYVDRNMC